VEWINYIIHLLLNRLSICIIVYIFGMKLINQTGQLYYEISFE